MDHQPGRQSPKVVETDFAQAQPASESMESLGQHVTAHRPAVRRGKDQVVVEPGSVRGAGENGCIASGALDVLSLLVASELLEERGR
jgi:hypothetical protein